MLRAIANYTIFKRCKTICGHYRIGIEVSNSYISPSWRLIKNPCRQRCFFLKQLWVRTAKKSHFNHSTIVSAKSIQRSEEVHRSSKNHQARASNINNRSIVRVLILEFWFLCLHHMIMMEKNRDTSINTDITVSISSST